MLIVDSNEKSEELFEVLESNGTIYKTKEISFYSCVECKKVYFLNKPPVCEECECHRFKREQAGDFTNENGTFLVERKSESDFWSSMVNKGLYVQMQKMSKFFKGVKVVMLEGFLSNVVLQHPKKKNWIESMPSTIAQYGIHFWQCDDTEFLINQLHWLDKKSGKAPKIRAKIDDKYKGYDQKLKLTCKLFDVGKTKGEFLLETFKSPMAIFKAILDTDIIYTKTGNPKGLDGPFDFLKGFGPKFIEKNKGLLLGI